MEYVNTFLLVVLVIIVCVRQTGPPAVNTKVRIGNNSACCGGGWEDDDDDDILPPKPVPSRPEKDEVPTREPNGNGTPRSWKPYPGYDGSEDPTLRN